MQEAETQRVAVARARSVVARKCRSIAASRMLTLTTREAVTDLERFWRLFTRFLQRCRRAGIEFRYVAVPELQKRGAWHLHVAIDRYLPHAQVYAEWIAVVGSGTADLHKFKARSDADKAIAVAGYISKYIGKTLMGAEFGRKRYRCSRGIEVSKETEVMDRRFTGDVVTVAEAFELFTGREPRSVRINDYGGAWAASWGDTFLDDDGGGDGHRHPD